MYTAKTHDIFQAATLRIVLFLCPSPSTSIKSHSKVLRVDKPNQQLLGIRHVVELAAHTHFVIISLSIIDTAIISLTLKVQLAVSLFYRLLLLYRYISSNP